jgi:hypothetical protein
MRRCKPTEQKSHHTQKWGYPGNPEGRAATRRVAGEKREEGQNPPFGLCTRELPWLASSRHSRPKSHGQGGSFIASCRHRIPGQLTNPCIAHVRSTPHCQARRPALRVPTPVLLSAWITDPFFACPADLTLSPITPSLAPASDSASPCFRFGAVSPTSFSTLPLCRWRRQVNNVPGFGPAQVSPTAQTANSTELTNVKMSVGKVIDQRWIFEFWDTWLETWVRDVGIASDEDEGTPQTRFCGRGR